MSEEESNSRGAAVVEVSNRSIYCCGRASKVKTKIDGQRRDSAKKEAALVVVPARKNQETGAFESQQVNVTKSHYGGTSTPRVEDAVLIQLARKICQIGFAFFVTTGPTCEFQLPASARDNKARPCKHHLNLEHPYAPN